MQDEIKKEIAKLEIERNIKILYAVESGSRAWGFASQNSDWDVRFIYVHHQDWYLCIDEKKDNIEFILPNDIDLSGWELRKALNLFKKSNPPLLEWLRSPILYQEKGELANKLRTASQEYFNPKSCLYHYFHMAKGNWEAYFREDKARIKKYFYVLRPLLACCWIKDKNTMPPMEFNILLNAYPMSNETRLEIDKLIIRKTQGEELDVDFRIPILDNFIEELLKYFNDFLVSYNFKTTLDTKTLNTIFRTTLSQAW